MFSSSVVRTSPMPPGAADSPAASGRTSSTGNMKDAITAVTAAANVPSRYSTTTRPMLLPAPSLPFASAPITRKNTSTGAIAFKAFTNRLPRIAIGAAWGTATPRIAPIIRPQIIRFTKLILFHFCQIFMMTFSYFCFFAAETGQ